MSDDLSPEDLEDRLIDFAVRVGKVADALPDTRMGRHVTDQIVRSGTSPAPNYSEGCAAESRRDFAHKLSIGLKELRETKTWLRFIRKADLLPAHRLSDITDEADQLCAILSKSIHTARTGGRRS
ncbi:four helix bundle protein [Salinibacter altiplanensis]|uniref:four helix bundle protein n=1 Tax=Salinibacter altiplanensis TaxID=1803181 RepID=UPI000C9FD985|nr:four helix bundle protein [Salinibacter altiplanensis]